MYRFISYLSDSVVIPSILILIHFLNDTGLRIYIFLVSFTSYLRDSCLIHFIFMWFIDLLSDSNLIHCNLEEIKNSMLCTLGSLPPSVYKKNNHLDIDVVRRHNGSAQRSRRIQTTVLGYKRALWNAAAYSFGRPGKGSSMWIKVVSENTRYLSCRKTNPWPFPLKQPGAPTMSSDALALA